MITDTKPDMRIQREETFGPAVTIVPVADEDEALRLANDSPYGLTASVWTADSTRGQRMASRLHFGSVFVNDSLIPSGAGEVPWGGVKDSGFGKTRGAHGLLEMTRTKHVSHDRLGLSDAPVWFPYSRAKYRAISDFVPCMFGVSPLWRVRAGARGVKNLLSGLRGNGSDVD